MIRFDVTCRLFPLPGVVLFPHGVLQLRVFEPRYRQLVAHALEDDRLVTVVQSRLGAPWPLDGEPLLEQVGCVGRIVAHERLPDGRYNILLMGLRRVRLGGELVAPGTLYRQAEATALADEPDRPGLDAERARLVEELERLADREESELFRRIEAGSGLGALIDAVAQVLPLAPADKQALLDETGVGRRLDRLRQALAVAANGARAAGPRRGSPGFSVN